MGRHLLIIGGGIIGLSTAYYAQRQGHRVTLLERGAKDHEGCSLGNAGLVVPSHFIPLAAPGMVALGLKWMWNPESPFYIKPRWDWELLRWGWLFWRAASAARAARAAPLLRDLHLASRAGYEDLAARFGNAFGLVKKGLLMLCKSARALDEEARTAGQARQLGLPAEVLTARQTRELDPHIRLDIAGSVYYPQDCHLTPAKLIAGLQQSLELAGAEFHWSTTVIGWRARQRRIDAVQTNQGDFSADEYVLCGGSWSPTVLQDLGLRLPMQAGKGYSLTLPNPRQLPTMAAILTEARVAVTPMGQALRFGGTMEIAGLDETINSTRVQGLIKAIPRYYPEFAPEDFQCLPVWRGLRPCSPDGLPYLGRFARYENLSTATGHAMMGLSLGPITGQLMADLLTGNRPAFDLSLLSPDRFQ